MRAFLILVIASCGGEPLIAQSDALAIQLGAGDPVIASERIREEAGGCDGLGVAIAALDRAAITPRLKAALIDEAIAAARRGCDDLAGSIASDGDAARIARSLLIDDPGKSLEALGDGGGPAVRFRRAELFSRLDRRDEAIAEIQAGLAEAEDPGWRARLIRELIAAGRASEAVSAAADADREQRAQIEALAAAGDSAEVAGSIAAAPIEARLELARAAVAAARDPAALATDGAPAPLLRAVGDRLAGAGDQDAAAALYRRAAALEPNDADLQSALAAALAAGGRLDEALAAWDRARALNPATPSAAIDPIAALVAAGRRDGARARARAIADGADAPAELEVASAAAAAAGDRSLALDLARRAHSLEPGNGAFAFLVARRLDQAGESDEALERLAELLRCGSRGRPWHRHEVAAEIVQIARRTKRSAAAIEMLDRPRCDPPQPGELASISAELRRKLESE